MMSNKIEKIIVSILENAPIVLTVAFGIFVVIKSQTKEIASDELLTWLLAIVSLLATSILVDRFSRLKRIELYSKRTNDYLTERDGKPSLDKVIETRKNLAPLEDRLKHSKEIVVTGGSLFRLTNEYISFFEKKAATGANLKFVLLDPDSEAAKFVANSIVYEINDYQTYKRYIETSIQSLSALKSKFPNNVEYRLQNFVPTYSIFGSDIDNEDGFIMVELYTYLTPTRQRPHMNILQRSEPIWFEYFRDQFFAIWNEASTK